MPNASHPGPPLRIVLAGNPNVGKTTVFNQLTGLRQRVANYPGVTVERKSGFLPNAPPTEVIDLPGTYSLHPKSLDERIATDMLIGRLERAPDVVVCVVDASNLERNLFLVTQVMDLGLPTIVALNMVDAATGLGLRIDAEALSRALGVPVIPLVATRGEGMEALRAALLKPPPPPEGGRWPLMDAVAARLPELTDLLAREAPEAHGFLEALRALAEDAALEAWAARAPAFAQAVKSARDALAERGVPYRHAEVSGRYNWIAPILARVVTKHKDPSALTLTDRIDAVLTHRLAGPALFLLILALVFQAVFSWAVPAMDLVEAAVGALGAAVRGTLPQGVVADLLVDGVITGVGNVVVFLPQILLLFFFLGLMEDTGYMARTAFIMDRVMKHVGLSGGSVLPLLSSFACAIPGIMAARTLDNERDRLITIMVAPLMSCSARLPIYTLFIAAFIPAGALFGLVGYQGLAMFSMYLMGILMAFVAAWVLKRFVLKGASNYFVMELPPYRLPRLKQVFWRMTQRSKIFAVRAGKIIFALSVVLWFLANYPKTAPGPEALALQAQADAERDASYAAAAQGGSVEALRAEPAVKMALDLLPRGASLDSLRGIDPAMVHAAEMIYAADRRHKERAQAADALAQSQGIRQSFIGRFGRALEPLLRPLGFDWKMSAGIVTAFAAREVIISTLGIIYSVGEVDETSQALREQLKADRYPDGRPVFTTLVAVSLLVFFVFALQCMSTLAIARRETNSWFWPAVMWCYMTGLAYLFSLLVYQGGRALGFT